MRSLRTSFISSNKEEEGENNTHVRRSTIFGLRNKDKDKYIEPSKSLRRSQGLSLKPPSPPTFGEYYNSSITEIPLTRQLFLHVYSKGKWNLSSIPAPACFHNYTMLKAPISYDENRRLRSVDSYMNISQWDDTESFKKLINKAASTFSCAGATISLIAENCQIIKYEKSFSAKEIPRSLSLDAHTILSAECFVLIDASKDWRTMNNPLVKGVPHIKFYLLVPLRANNGDAIGALSVFDVFSRNDFSRQSVQQLQEFASQVMKILNDTSRSNRKPLKIADPENINKVDIRNNLLLEKDGSGTAFSHNQRFRLNTSKSDLEQKSLRELGRSLASCSNVEQAAAKLCSKLHESQNLDFVYIMEIKVSESYRINAELLPMENKMEAEGFIYADRLERTEGENIKTRVLGTYGLNVNSLKFEPLIHYEAFSSEFGIKYHSNENGIRFKSGICLPIAKINSKIVRRKPISVSTKVVPNTKVEVYLRSGGFLIAGFNKTIRYISDEEIDEIVQWGAIFRQIYLMSP